MKILVIGSDDRENTVAWKLAQSEQVEKIYAAPGNGGTSAEQKCENVSFEKNPASEAGQKAQGEWIAALIQFVRQKKIDFTVVSLGKKGSIRPFVSARDHKRRFDGGIGPNTGSDADAAWTKAYEAIKCINFEGMAYRKDIGREDIAEKKNHD